MPTKKTTNAEMQEVAEKVVKKKRKSSPRPNQTVQTNPGDNAKIIHHSLMLAKLPKVDMSDAAAVTDRTYEYFKICEDNDVKPSVAGLALAFDIEREYLWQLREGKRGKNTEVAHTLKKAMKLLDLQMVDYMQNGKINPVSGIFLMKNNFGYADKQEVVVTPNNPLEGDKDVAALEEQYKASVPIDTEGTEVEGTESK